MLSWELYEHAMQTVTIKVALDIGANEGGYTRTLLEHGFIVHAFEPVPDVFDKLFAAHHANPNVFLQRIGLSDEMDKLENVTVLEAWTIGKPGDGNLSVSPAYVGKRPFSVHLWTVDAYLGHRDVGLIKLDVDGYEAKVLEGARETLRRCRPPILCELSKYIELLGTSAEKFARLVFDLGYKFVSMDGKFECSTWKELAPYYPHDTSFDVMLMPVA